jgi:hypothetical protein
MRVTGFEPARDIIPQEPESTKNQPNRIGNSTANALSDWKDLHGLAIGVSNPCMFFPFCACNVRHIGRIFCDMPTIPDGKYHIVRQLDGWIYCTDQTSRPLITRHHFSKSDSHLNGQIRDEERRILTPLEVGKRERAVREWIDDRRTRIARWNRAHATAPTTPADRRIARFFGAGTDATPPLF